MANKSVAFFHPYQENKGYAAIFNFSPDRGTFFAKFMPEVNGRFSSENAINIAIGNNDLGEILAVLNGRKAGVGQFKDNRWAGLYHDLKSKNTSTILNLYIAEDNGSYTMGLSQKVGDGQARRVGGRLTLGEASLLLAFFESQIPDYFAAQAAQQEQEWANRRNGGGGESERPATAPASTPASGSKSAPATNAAPSKSGGRKPAVVADDENGVPF